MRKPKPTLRQRRSGSRYEKLRLIRRRPLKIESLEDRVLLAGDLGLPSGIPSALPEGEGPSPLMAVRLEAVDPQSFQPLEAVHQGEEFLLLASVSDLRPEASGVYAAYLDILFPAEFLTVPIDTGRAPLFYGNSFGNGVAGEVLTGLVDELGTFAGGVDRPGADQQVLAGVRMVATQMGEVQISSNAAESSPEHDILLFDRDDPVSTNLVTYGDLTLQILAPLPHLPVDAMGDFQVVSEDSTGNHIAVLKNDKNTTGSRLVITGVDTSKSHGDVTIVEGGTQLSYTPARGFVGTDSFTYTIMANGEEDTANVRVEVQRVVSHEDRVAFNLEITDLAGKQVSVVDVGDEFVLHVSAEDLRDIPKGVFAAYMDLLYPAHSVQVAGAIAYGPSYPNEHVGDISTPGMIDEVGGFSDTDPLGGGAFEVFRIPFHATAPGRVVFEADPAENDPGSQTLLYDLDEAVRDAQTRFGRVTLTVVPAVVAVDDTYVLSTGGATASFAVLENDVDSGSGDLSVVSVDDSGLLGTVQVAANGRGVVYTPPTGFGGSEQFAYTVSGSAGTSTAEVTVHIQPAASSNDQLEIKLVTTDLEGNAISSVAAGQEFLVQAIVDDLRGPGVDRGVYAAYFDLLYDRTDVRPVQTQLGPIVVSGPDYANGVRGDASVPGILNEIGAFQTGSTPLGTEPSLLLAARFRAAPAIGEADSLQILEDAEAILPVLENDRPNSGTTTFTADPADDNPFSETLLYEPVGVVSYDRIRYGNATLNINAGGAAEIASVSPGSAGGRISIATDGASLIYSPARNFNGVETFTYSLDGESQISVSVAVLPVNDAPVAVSDSYRVRENRVLEIAANAGIAANDVDPDGDPLDLRLLEEPSHGVLELGSDGSFRYVPEENFIGRDSFVYRVTDGEVESSAATVWIDVVPRPVSIRLEAVNAAGDPVSEIEAGGSVVVRTLVQDFRSSSDTELGIGAAYLDIAYDPQAITPAQSAGGPLGLKVQFGSAYGNGVGGEVLPEGRLNDIGAFQSSLLPLGGEEIELLRLTFNSSGPRAADDSFIVAGGTSVNRLNVVENEADLRWDITLDAQHASNSPTADVLYLDPAAPVPVDDITYGDITLAVQNGTLTIQSVGDTQSDAVVSILSDGQINYEPAPGFTGIDSFTYTVVDAHGLTATATVTVAVTASWQNLSQPTDVNGDGEDSPIDALVVINELNTNGPHVLDDQVISAFLDVNGDGIVSPIDVLLVINRFLLNGASGEGESTAAHPGSENDIQDVKSTAPIVPNDALLSSLIPASHLTIELPQRTADRANASVDQAVSPVSLLRVEPLDAASVDSEDSELTELFEAIAMDVAPLWAVFS